MICSLTELKAKDVINVRNGENLGFADDISIDTATSSVTGIIIYGRPSVLGMFGKRRSLHIPSSRIKLVGKDVMLVDIEPATDMCKCNNNQW